MSILHAESLRMELSEKNLYDSIMYKELKIKSLDIQTKNSKIQLEIPVQKAWLNYNGSVHGGAIAALMELYSVFFVLAMGNKTSTILDLSISILNPALLGDILEIEIVCPRIEENIAFMIIEIKSKQKKIAQGNGKVLKTAKTNWEEKL